MPGVTCIGTRGAANAAAGKGGRERAYRGRNSPALHVLLLLHPCPAPCAHQVVRVLRPHGVRVVHNDGDGLALCQALWWVGGAQGGSQMADGAQGPAVQGLPHQLPGVGQSLCLVYLLVIPERCCDQTLSPA